jgi:nicotinamidase/pyrazinamidase
VDKKSLIMIDLQNDFCAGGALAVPAGNEVIPLANILQAQFETVIATQDWHPPGHISFAASHPGRQLGDVVPVLGTIQVLWPTHCEIDSTGAAFHPDLDVSKIQKIIYKGTRAEVDSYSAFFDNADQYSTGLENYLHEMEIKQVYLMGLATDYCVKYSALDAVKLGFDTFVIVNGCRGVELKQGDIAAALQEMQAAGVKLIEMN